MFGTWELLVVSEVYDLISDYLAIDFDQTICLKSL